MQKFIAITANGSRVTVFYGNTSSVTVADDYCCEWIKSYVGNDLLGIIDKFEIYLGSLTPGSELWGYTVSGLRLLESQLHPRYVAEKIELNSIIQEQEIRAHQGVILV
jgi:hypothetical protein